MCSRRPEMRSQIRLRATGEAEAIRAKGKAQASAYSAGAEAIGAEGYTTVQLMQIIGEKAVRIIPEVNVSGNGNNGGGIADALMAVMLKDKLEPDRDHGYNRTDAVQQHRNGDEASQVLNIADHERGRTGCALFW